MTVALLALALLPRVGAPNPGAPRFAGPILAREVRQDEPAAGAALERIEGTRVRAARDGEALSFTSDVVDAGQRFDYLGVHWIPAADRELLLEVRTSPDRSSWSGWTPRYAEEDMTDETTGERYAAPLDVGDARYAQYRVWITDGDPSSARSVALTFMDVSDRNASPLARLASDLRGAATDVATSFTAEAASAPVRIYSRADWGADESLMQWTPQYVPWKKAIVHHTVTTNGYSTAAPEIRAIYYYHAATRGWGDIGYNFIVDRYGNVWAGRQGGDDVVGGHAYGWNDGTFGVAALGTFSTDAPPASMLQGIAGIIGLKFAQRGIQPFGAEAFTHQEENSAGDWVKVTTSPPNVIGHRDCNYVLGGSGGQTSCPGGMLYKALGGIRSSAQSLANGGFANLVGYGTQMPHVASVGQTLFVPVTLRNAGVTTISAASTRLSYRIVNATTGAVVVSQGPLSPLGTDLRPGTTQTVVASLNVPAAGRYVVRWDLFTIGAGWYSSLTGAPARDEWLAAIEWDTTWIGHTAPATMSAGQSVPVTVTVQNTGGRVWPAQYVRLSYHWISDVTSRMVVWDGNRGLLPYDVRPGQTISVPIAVSAPAYPTRYRLEFDMVWEGQFWFGQKGVETLDAIVNVPFDFRAGYQVTPTITVAPGQRVTVPVTLTNTGSSTWSATGSVVVDLGSHWYTSDGSLVEWDGDRAPLASNVTPGQSVTVQASETAPATPGAYQLRFDLVLEGVAWFSNRGTAPGVVNVTVRAPQYGAKYQPGPVGAIAAAARTTVPVTVTNTSDFAWTPGAFNLAYHAYDAAGKLALWDGVRAALPSVVQPGQTVTLQAVLSLPSSSGSYTVKWDMVQEGLTWFSDRGVPPATQEVFVGTQTYGAAYNTILAPATMTTALTWTVGVYVTNTSSFAFSPWSNVFLSYHWYDANGDAVVWDGKRSTANIPAGQTSLVYAEVAGPPSPGSYRLAFDLVQEGVAWFSDRGIAPSVRAVDVVVPDYGALYLAPMPAGGALGQTITLPVTVTNTGSRIWANDQVFLSYHVYRSGQLVVWDGVRTALPSPLTPGQSATLSAAVKLPATPGGYDIRFDLVQEGVTWFSGQGVPMSGAATVTAQ